MQTTSGVRVEYDVTVQTPKTNVTLYTADAPEDARRVIAALEAELALRPEEVALERD